MPRKRKRSTSGLPARFLQRAGRYLRGDEFDDYNTVPGYRFEENVQTGAYLPPGEVFIGPYHAEPGQFEEKYPEAFSSGLPSATLAASLLGIPLALDWVIPKRVQELGKQLEPIGKEALRIIEATTTGPAATTTAPAAIGSQVSSRPPEPLVTSYPAPGHPQAPVTWASAFLPPPVPAPPRSRVKVASLRLSPTQRKILLRAVRAQLKLSKKRRARTA